VTKVVTHATVARNYNIDHTRISRAGHHEDAQCAKDLVIRPLLWLPNDKRTG
jgi:hypothetical protein